MSAVKQEVQKMLNNLPQDCTYEDIQYHLYVKEKIEQGLLRAKDDSTITHQKAKQKMDKWLSH